LGSRLIVACVHRKGIQKDEEDAHGCTLRKRRGPRIATTGYFMDR
jgi:hypothetical protein